MNTPEITPEMRAYIDSKIAAGIEAATMPASKLTEVETEAAIEAIRSNHGKVADSHRVQGRPNAHQVAAWKAEYAGTRRGNLTQEEFDTAFVARFGYTPGGQAVTD